MSLEIYKEIENIKSDNHKKLYIVQSEIDHLFYIKRVLDTYDIHIYKAIMKLALPHVPKIKELYEINHQCMIIEEYMNCSTLDVYILNHELTQQQAFEIIRQLCQTLKVLHEYHIVHRDIKPENIFYDGQDVFLFDFDISRIHQEDQNKDTQLLGSYGYAAPEQFGFAQSDERTDIYALGILWNVMLCGKFPQEELYNGFETSIIQKAIQLDPLHRYQSIDEMEKQLHKKNQTSWAIPGFRSSKWSIRIVASLLYMLLLAVIAVSEFEGVHPWSFIDIVDKILILGFFMIIIFFAGNYRDIYQECIFHNANHILIRIVGRVLSGFLMVVSWILLIGIFLGIIS